MEQQGFNSETDLPGFSSSEHSNFRNKTGRKIMWSNATFRRSHEITTDEDPLNAKIGKKDNVGFSIMSNEELKIRAELEIDIENDLEAEIKDGICSLALRLHRLYRHQRDRIAQSLGGSSTDLADFQSKAMNPVFTEMNLVIRMDEGSRIEILERKKEISKLVRYQKSEVEENSKIGNKPNTNQNKSRSNSNQFDWVRTLRSGASSDACGKKNRKPLSSPTNKANYPSLTTIRSTNSQKQLIEIPNEVRRTNRKLWCGIKKDDNKLGLSVEPIQMASSNDSGCFLGDTAEGLKQETRKFTAKDKKLLKLGWKV